MHIGSLLVPIGTGAKKYFTPWFPTGADNAVFTFELIQSYLGSGGSFTVAVFTKNREDVGSEGTAVGATFSTIGSTHFYESEPCTNLKQLVRFKITFTPGTGSNIAALYRVLPPTWYDTAV